MLFKNKFLLFQLIIFESKDFFSNNRNKIIKYIFISIFLIIGYSIYLYYNRLELINCLNYKGEIFELYQDWSKSTGYHWRYESSIKSLHLNYYVIKKNGKIYFKYQHNYPFVGCSYEGFYFKKVEQDSLVFVQKGDENYGVVYLKMPLNKNRITKKDVRIIPIYPGILKDGSKQRIDDSIHYFLDDFKKVPVEVINYENIISDY